MDTRIWQHADLGDGDVVERGDEERASDGGGEGADCRAFEGEVQGGELGGELGVGVCDGEGELVK